MYSHIVVPRIKAMLPDVKLLAIFRNPIDRAYSRYTMCCDRRNELGIPIVNSGDIHTVIQEELEIMRRFGITVSGACGLKSIQFFF